MRPNARTEKRPASTLKSSEARYRRVFETAKDGILILDAADGKILDANPFMTELTGYDRDELLGRHVWEIGRPEDEAANREMFRKLQREEFVRFDHLPLAAKDGSRVDVEFVSNVYEVENRTVAQCNIRDVRERIRSERQARDQARALDDLHRRKDEIMAVLSHELRGPLAPLANAVQVLHLAESGDPVQREATAIIDRQVTRLARLIDDLLDVAGIATGSVRLSPERLDVAGVVEDAAVSVRPLMRRRGHAFTVDLPPQPIELVADPARMRQLLGNLLTNAAEYTEEDGHITLSVRREGDECVLRIRDTGVGISPELLPRIFDLFTQADRAVTRTESGLGVGLAIVQRLVALHHGTVEVSSTEGTGSEFVLRLPVAGSPNSLKAPPAHAPARGPRPLKILVVEDVTDSAVSLMILLKSWGHDVRMADDAASAAREALQFLPDVILLDIGLPGVDGFEVAKWARTEPGLRHCVLVAVTGYGQDTDRMRSKAAGFDHHLVKPAQVTDLRRILASVAETAR